MASDRKNAHKLSAHRHEICLCLQCTSHGQRPEGSLQSKSNKQRHAKDQKFLNIELENLAEVEKATLRAILEKDSAENSIEDPLWRGSAMHIDVTNHKGTLAGRTARHGVSFSFPNRLVFRYPPISPTSMYPGPLACSEYDDWTNGPSALNPDELSNAPILLHIQYLIGTLNSRPRSHLPLYQELQRMENFRQSEWHKQQLLSTGCHSGRSERHYSTEQFITPPILQRPVVVVGLFLVVALNLFHHLARSGCRLALHLLRSLIKLAFVDICGPVLPPDAQSLVEKFPVDLQAARKVFFLEPVITRYACCPKCFALYPPSTTLKTSNSTQPQERGDSDGNLNDPHWGQELPFHEHPVLESRDNCDYPRRCSYRETIGSRECGQRLVHATSKELDQDLDDSVGPENSKQKAKVLLPVKTYTHQSLKSWLARFLFRPGIESILEDVWDKVRQPHIDGTAMSDIWDSPEIRDFKGPDGKLFHDNPNNEGRYLFGLFVDWFNPMGNKQAGKSMSSGVVFMTCLNLPLNLRYKRENVYLMGVIPGPKSPSLDQINHFLSLLVDEMLEFWSPGVRFSRTALYPHGRLIRCAVIPLIADLGAVKKTAGQGSHSASYFCSFCDLKLQEIDNLDAKSWPCRDCEERKRLAFKWRNASSLAQRKALFKEHGIRFTELLRLPYWKLHFVVLEVMHNIFLGLFQRHCRYVFGMDIKEEKIAELQVIPEPAMIRGRELLQSGSSVDDLTRKLKKQVLVNLMIENQLIPGKMKKKEMSKMLVGQRDGLQVSTNDPEGLPSKVLNKRLLEEIQGDIAKTVLPSWIGRAPPDIGNPAHGKLSADQWRTLCTVHLPVTLTRVWSQSDATRNQTKMLENFLDLVTAVLWGTPRRLTKKNIKVYDHYIFKYTRGLLSTYPDLHLIPNQHYAMHLGDILRRFGPTHAYWAFPFERFIGLLRQIRTNQKPSELEMTFMNTFCMASNLRAMVTSNLAPAILQEFETVIDAAIGNDSRGTLMSDIMSFGAQAEPKISFDEGRQSPLSHEVYSSLMALILRNKNLHEGLRFVSHDAWERERDTILNPNAQHLQEVKIRGLSFKTKRSCAGDSLILFTSQGQGSTPQNQEMGQIQDIFIHRRASLTSPAGHREAVFVSLRIFPNLTETDRKHDPYRRFKYLGMKLMYRTLSPETIVIPARDIIAHFASCHYDHPSLVGPQSCMVAIPLNRVRTETFL